MSQPIPLLFATKLDINFTRRFGTGAIQIPSSHEIEQNYHAFNSSSKLENAKSSGTGIVIKVEREEREEREDLL